MNITLDANSQGDIRSCLGEETAGKNKGKTCYALLPVTDVASDGENYVSPKRIALNLLSLIVPQADHKVDEYFLRYVETHRRPRVSAPNITANQIAEIIKRVKGNSDTFFRGMVKAKNEDDCVGRNVNKVEERIDGKEGKVCERREPTLHHPVTGPTSFCH
ncbi:hypothetical protein HZH68_006395 [Vespula germanica]|uniref:Uncharacterized protein n=1 Tax=Vespula germanica TaxID=30212 RepID=A0A834KD81_VESGE|nr:hypothetical protein HZH68_006395 [Vespula germanica]